MKIGEKVDFEYTGEAQSFTVPVNGIYRLECWGASGKDVAGRGYGGKGGYSSGLILLNENSTLHIYVGQSPTSNAGGWNGGGAGASSFGGGGGSTDIRFTSGRWDDPTSLLSRIIVAGGGGGVGGNHSNNNEVGGFGGGDVGGQGVCPNYSANDLAQYSGYGGTQTEGGKIGTDSRCTGIGAFGKGGSNTSNNGSGGGGGWFGGGAGCYEPAGGGSGYVLTDTSHKPSGYTPTSNYWMTDTQLLAGNVNVPLTTGSGTQLGHLGNGFARITFVELVRGLNVKCNINGQFKDTESMSVKIDNTWKEVESVFVKIGNEWKLNE